MDVKARFLSHVDVREPDECWEWTGGKDKGGYGAFRLFHNQQVTAHRASYILFVEPDFTGGVVRHSCDNPPCVNPNHLIGGTQKENIHDMYAKGRQNDVGAGDQRGEANHFSNLTIRQVATVREMYNSGVSQAEIMKQTGISRSNVWAIVHGKSWRYPEAGWIDEP